MVGEGDALLDVALQARNGGFQQSLLLLGDVAQDVDSLLSSVGLEEMVSGGFPREGGCGTHAKLDRHGEEVTAGLLGDLITARDTREVDIAGLDEALGTR